METPHQYAIRLTLVGDTQSGIRALRVGKVLRGGKAHQAISAFPLDPIVSLIGARGWRALR